LVLLRTYIFNKSPLHKTKRIAEAVAIDNLKISIITATLNRA